jgi:hypothetical protein
MLTTNIAERAASAKCRRAITKHCECGETEDREIRSGADTGEWKPADDRVTAAEHFRAA